MKRKKIIDQETGEILLVEVFATKKPYVNRKVSNMSEAQRLEKNRKQREYLERKKQELRLMQAQMGISPVIPTRTRNVRCVIVKQIKVSS